MFKHGRRGFGGSGCVGAGGTAAGGDMQLSGCDRSAAAGCKGIDIHIGRCNDHGNERDGKLHVDSDIGTVLGITIGIELLWFGVCVDNSIEIECGSM